MSWNGSGTYTPPAASFPEVNGTLIDAARFNATINDMATGITTCLTKDGQNAATANLLMGGFKHTGAVAAATSGEYLVHSQADGRLTDLTVNSTLTAWGAGINFIDLGTTGAIFNSAFGLQLLRNSYSDGADLRAKTAAAGYRVNMSTSKWALYSAPSVAAGAVQTFTEILNVDDEGVLSGTSLSGDYTPTATASTNIDSVSAFRANWVRLGNTIVVTGSGTVNCTAGSASSKFLLDPPVSTVFPATTYASGTININSSSGVYVSGRIIAELAGSTVAALFYNDATTGSVGYSYVYSYEA